ncbi:hypothetical protein C8J57DRAFT_1270464 [Mycena rebaudengoi]|nr:hypothetical protein C8J57DRAFT_1270464 [Mycena rebaudengoi]
MHPGFFLSLFFCISLVSALDSSPWSRRSRLRHKKANLQRRSIPTGWTYVGCVTDGSARALSYSYTSTSMTQDSCISTCDSKGYIYGGPQYGKECWCGNSLANNLGLATASSECNMACAGNSSQMCGAGYRMNLFKKTTGWTLSKACVVDTSSRILQGYAVTSSSNTPSACQSTCASKGFSMAGVENGNECHCANSFYGGTPTVASTSDCSVACSGDSSSKCGGGWRLQIYTAGSGTATATSTSATTSATSAPGWVLSNACVVDSSSRILQGYGAATSSNTPATCQSTCASKGFSMAGVENGNECYCANSFSGGNPTVVSTSDCSVACSGNSSAKCGGGWRLQVYTSTATTTKTTSTTVTATATPSVPAAPHFVVFGDLWVSGTTGPPPISDIKLALSFLLTKGAWDKAQEWTTYTDAQRATVKAQYAAAGIKLIKTPTTSGINPVTMATTMANWVIRYNLDGIDVDYEDLDAFNAGDGKAEAWLISFTTQLRTILPQGQYIITHTRTSPFSPNKWGGGGYLKINTNVGNLIDWYNLQGPSEYTTCANLLTGSSNTFPKTALFQIAAAGIPLSKLVIGKPATSNSAPYGGYIAPSSLAGCLATAKNQGWTGGVSVWQFPDAGTSWISAARLSAWPVSS